MDTGSGTGLDGPTDWHTPSLGRRRHELTPPDFCEPGNVTRDTATIGRRMAVGAAWVILMRMAVRGLGLVSTVVLARLLVPQDFGLVALATLLYGLVDMLGAFNFDVVLIREQRAGRDYYDTVWTLAIIRGAVMAGLLGLLAAPAAVFFGEPRLKQVVWVLALGALVQGFGNIGVVDFQKELNFRSDFKLHVAGKLTSCLATLVFASILQNYWALVWGMLTGSVGGLVLTYAMHPFRPLLSLSRWREIFGFSKWLLVNNILHFLYRRADTFVVGRLLGAGSLGVYSVAYEISTLATTELVAPIRRALLPGYAQLAAEPDRLRASFSDDFAVIMLIAAPLAAGIGVTADPLVRLFLGAKWLDVIPLLQITCIFGLLQLCSANTFPLYLALGKPRLTTVLAATGAALGVPTLLWATYTWGTVGTAWAITGTAAVTLAINLTLALRLVHMSMRGLLARIWRTAVATAVMTSTVEAFLHLSADSASYPVVVAQLATAVGLGAITYTGTHLTLWYLSGRPHGSERQVLDVVSDLLPRRRADRAA